MSDKNEDQLIGKILFKHYKLKKKIGEGSFGRIYVGINIDTKEEYAIKLVRNNYINFSKKILLFFQIQEERNSQKGLLETEAYILQHLRAFGIPEIKHYGYNSLFNILIMELLGQSLENLFHAQNKSFSIKTACMLGVQMIDRIEFVHSRKIIHRDIKPDNFVMGRGSKSHIVYILDFGLSKKYWSVSHKCHLPFIKGKKLTGTARYASINALSGFEQSRRDDLESIGYIIMYFIRGSLPWQGLKVNKKENRFNKICEKKKETSAKDLCAGFPTEFETFVSYTRNLQFTEVPNYNYLRNLLKTILKKGGFTFDFYYDWCTTKPHIKPDDPIYTNDYKIVYNGPNDWLNSETIKELEMKENGNNDNINQNKIESNLGKSFPINHSKPESSNMANKYTVSKNEKSMNFPSSKKYK